jgi:DNA repair protein RecN (Recombination protein N)
MLSLLHIENIAVIELAEIQFDAGFNVLTGETGAGKSIVVDAIGAVLGGRTSRDLIRTGAKSALVTAEFVSLPALEWFGENGMWPDENGSLILTREIRADGKNICRLNGRPLSLAQLKELGRQLLNIHGQHDGQQLLDPACHLDYLDGYGETGPLLASFQESYAQVSELKRRIIALRMDDAEKARRIDTLSYQIEELERANLQPGEDEALTERRNILRNAGKLIEAINGAYTALYGTDDEDGAVSQVMEAESHLRGIGRYSDSFAQMAEQLSEMRYELDEMVEQVRAKRDELDFSGSELDEVESRLDLIYRLRKKYGATVEDMLAYLAKCKQELDQIAYSSDMIERLKKKLAVQLQQARERAVALSKARKEAAVSLQQRIQKELADLDMPKVRFQVEFSVKQSDFHMDNTGMDEVQFLMSANVGEDLKPIHKIASGGELARIMLALKNVLAENEQITTLVFDEVDTGVSGRAASKVARKMADVATYKQVLTVTHLPQIAAMADVHFSVEKGERDGRTYTRLERLDREQRKQEIARLTGGSIITEATLKSAGELMDESELYRKQRTGRRAEA